MTVRMDPAIYVLEDRLEQLRQEARVLELAISALLVLSIDDDPPSSIDQGTDSTRPPAVESVPTPSVAPPVVLGRANECECGRVFETAHGLLVHQRRTHKDDLEPVGNVATFDPDAARAAAAAAT